MSTAMNPGMHMLWPTPLGIHRFDQASEVNPLIARVLSALRAGQESSRGQTRQPFFASDDDLLQRVQLQEWSRFVRFVVQSLRDTVKAANEGYWPQQGVDLQVLIDGMWFQVSNGGAFHDVHTHGNCSWSGVYVVQVDEAQARERHPTYGSNNGVTRFYGPPFGVLGGAHVDVGNAYLLPPHRDVPPIPGQLVLFPSWLAHQALPYAGELDRIIISFNASVHTAKGDRLHGYSAH